MIENLLAHVIEDAFEKMAGKGQYETGKAMHIGFHKHTSGSGGDQYHVTHMYLFGPDNYVYVAFQDEFIGARGKRRVGEMEIACCHDSCWRDAIQTFLFKNRNELSTFAAFKRLLDWNDIITLSKEEIDYLRHLRNWKQSGKFDPKVKFSLANPFDKRGIWKD
jgi:hypothetical protein